MNPREHLRAGADVTYTAHPDWGTGQIKKVTLDRLQVRFDHLTPPYEGEFHPSELIAVIPSETPA